MLGDSIEVTYMIGAGKTDTEMVKVEGVGGSVRLAPPGGPYRDDPTFAVATVPDGLIYVTSYTRKGVKVQRLVVSQAMFVAAVERKRR